MAEDDSDKEWWQSDELDTALEEMIEDRLPDGPPTDWATVSVPPQIGSGATSDP